MRPTPFLSCTLVLSALTALACTGATLGENEPGADVYMEGSPGYDAEEDGRCVYTGSIATDEGSTRAWAMVTEHAEDCWDVDSDDVAESKLIYAATPGVALAEPMLDVGGYEDVRLLQPSAGLLVMAEEGGADNLFLLDPEALELVDHQPVSARYHGTRLSPSRRWVAVADNNELFYPIHILDPETSLEPTVIPHGGDWLEGMWLSQSDRFAAVIFNLELATVRLVVWDMEGLDSLADCEWEAPLVSRTLTGFSPDWSFSFTWIGVAPDDGAVVFPMKDAEGEHILLVMDPDSGALREVRDAAGPVGFTPDGGTIVSYRYDDDDDPVLLLIDAATLAVTEWPIPMVDGPSYFVTREGGAVVIASSYGGDSLIVYDIETGGYTHLGGPGLSLDLNEFVSRMGHDELWLVSDGLFRLDFTELVLEPIGTDFFPRHINHLPEQDLLVLDDEVDPRLIFYDPDSRDVHSEARFDAPAERVGESPEQIREIVSLRELAAAR